MKQVIRKAIKEKHNIDTAPPIYTLLLDMNSIMKMSLVNKKINNKGEEIGMVFNTLLQIRNLLTKKDFNFCYACYDGFNSGILRSYIYEPYKQNRDKHYELAKEVSEYDKQINAYVRKVLEYAKGKKKQVKRDETEEENFLRQREIIFDCLEELFIRNIMCKNVEGDDLIAYYVKNKQPNEKIMIVSGDRDLVQLIDTDVSLYVTQLKKIVTVDNCVKELGYRHDNVVLKKIICGDSSDNIYGIKGMGEATLHKLFPQLLTEKCTLNSILEHSKALLEERKAQKKKPLKTLENMLNNVTDGVQGEKIYEINEKIISLDKPMLTDSAKEEFDLLRYTPLDPSDRGSKNLYKIVQENNIEDLLDGDKFSTFFSPFATLVANEKKFFKKC